MEKDKENLNSVSGSGEGRNLGGGGDWLKNPTNQGVAAGLAILAALAVLGFFYLRPNFSSRPGTPSPTPAAIPSATPEAPQASSSSDLPALSPSRDSRDIFSDLESTQVGDMDPDFVELRQDLSGL